MNESSIPKFSKFQKLARLPLVITIVVLLIGWAFFFFWSVREKFESHIETGAVVARYLGSELKVELKDCRETQSGVRFRNADLSDFDLANWVKLEKSLGESSVVGTILKERKLIWDHVPVSSCRLWPQILDRIREPIR